jgi:predicted Zn-dependent peptidase
LDATLNPPSLLVRSPSQRYCLENGIRLILIQNPTVNIVAARIFLAAGGRVESADQAGVSSLVAAVLTKGAAHYDSQAFAATVEALGASITADSTADYFEVSLKCVANDFPQTLFLINQVLRYPNFPRQEVEREQSMLLQAIRSQQERPFTVAFDHLRAALYADHPYAFSSLGKIETVQGLTRADLVKYHATYFRPQQMVMVVVSPLPEAQVLELVSKGLGDWQAVQPAAPAPEPIWCSPDRSLVLRTVQATQQSIVMVGFQAAAVSSSDYPALKLMTTYLGSGLSSRLFVELREKRGLAYEVSAFYATRRDPSPWVAYLGTAPENTATALAGLQAELQRLIDDPLSDAEVETAKRKHLGQYALGKQTNAQIAQLLGWYETLGLGIEFDQTYPAAIQTITAAEIQRVAQTYLAIPIISLVGPSEALDLVVE